MFSLIFPCLDLFSPILWFKSLAFISKTDTTNIIDTLLYYERLRHMRIVPLKILNFGLIIEKPIFFRLVV